MRLSLKVLSGLLVFAVVAVGCDAPTSAVTDSEGPAATVTKNQGGPGVTAPNQGQDHSKATGEVTWVAGIERSASFNAHEDAPGTPSDRGDLYQESEDGSFTVEVSCVDIEGNEATFAGEVVDASGQFENRVGQYRVTTVYDGGTPGRTGDKYGGRFFEEDQCSSLSSVRTFEVTDGNLKVRD